ncbi:ATP-binding cassette domain-containing protein [Streptomyces sp. NPDC096339]|uniref:ABC transporter ATP-binding protein n=1 Tax=Streptomyces sp. NPDC096339 TaxID=3366086 RepID=UPI00381B12B4
MKQTTKTAHPAAGSPAGAHPAIQLRGAAKSFGPVHAVAAIDLAIGRGETVALLGRNGAGKSTAISLLLGLNEPDTGTVSLFGGTAEQAVRAGRVGAMLQEGRAVPRITVREVVAFVARTHPAPMPVAEALELAGLATLAGRRVDKLSGGQAQRVRFAVALAGNPELIVLDEPTAALDVEARRTFWESMRGYARRGNTVLFSTHYLEEADAHADRIVVIERGRIVADGTAEQLRRTAGGGSLVSFDLGGRSSAFLGGLPGVSCVEIRGDRARLRTRDPDATVTALAALGALRGIEVTAPSLEDAFLALTGEAATETPPAPAPVSAAAPAPEEKVR